MIKKKIKRKLADFLLSKLESFNRIDESANIHKDTFIKGSRLNGNVVIQQGVKLYKVIMGGNIEIGEYSSLWGPGIDLYAHINKISIGRYCSIARYVTIQEYNHNSSLLTTSFIGKNESSFNEEVSKGDIIIGHDVWIGVKATILSGVAIGNGAIVGANAVVTKDVPPYAIVGGNPAKVIKYRFDLEEINRIEKSEWWNWSVEKVIQNKRFFYET